MIIENCCCHKQLPELADRSFGRVMPYHTNGDVVLEKVIRAVAGLCGKSAITLILPEVNFRLCEVLRHGQGRGWWTHINILTSIAHKQLESVPDVTEVVSLNITNSSQMLIMEGETGRIALTGYHPLVSPVDSKKPYRMVNHTMLYQVPTAYDEAMWREMTFIPTARLRTALRKPNLVPDKH